MRSDGFLRTLLRRKLFTAAGLLVSIGLGVLAGWSVGPSYSAEAVVVLLPPTGRDQVQNPYLYLGGIQQARDVVQRSLTSETVAADFRREHPAVTYHVDRDPMSEGPLLVLTTEAPTSAATTNALDDLLGRVPDAVRSLQDRLQVAADVQIQALTVTVDKKPMVETKGQIRAGIALVALGFGSTALIVALLDAPLTRRKERRASASEPGAVAPTATGRPKAAQPKTARTVDPRGSAKPSGSPMGKPAPNGRPRGSRNVPVTATRGKARR